MMCKRCQNTPRDWVGDERTCAFSGGEFGRNWNCATVNRLRDHTYEGQKLLPIVDYQYCSDQKYATVNLDDFSEDTETDSMQTVLALWVTWYKNRGATDAIYLLSASDAPRVPSEAELNEICDYLDRVKARMEATPQRQGQQPPRQ